MSSVFKFYFSTEQTLPTLVSQHITQFWISSLAGSFFPQWEAFN